MLSLFFKGYECPILKFWYVGPSRKEHVTNGFKLYGDYKSKMFGKNNIKC